jgi:ATP-binding cassette, subfamily C, bacterial PrsD
MLSGEHGAPGAVMRGRIETMQQARPTDPVREALGATGGLWLHLGIFSALVNLLMLTGSLYMMQVYDRVLASRSIPTLVGVSLLALAAFALQGWLDHVRMRMLSRISAAVDLALAPLALRAVMAPGAAADPAEAGQPLRDLQALCAFLASPGPTALLDMPFVPLFLLITFLLHPWLGLLGLAGMATVLLLALMAERRSALAGRAVTASANRQLALAETGRRSAELVRALGMSGAHAALFRKAHAEQVGDALQMSEAAGAVTAFAKCFRFVLQSAVLGLGAFLAIGGELSAGSMLAASILVARALAPVEGAVAHLKSLTAARHGHQRLSAALRLHVEPATPVALPRPCRMLQAQDLAATPPGARQPTIAGVTFELRAGEAMALIGPSGSGKSTLARALVGALRPVAGGVRLDGALLTQWEPDTLGRLIGYLPQECELFAGTIAANIARLDPAPDPEAVIKAARAAGAHDMIVGFPEGYAKLLGEGGSGLSGGQRQRIALARALYGEPFLVVLDEPNSGLDAEGDAALAEAIRAVRDRGGIVVLVTHRQAGLAAADLVGVMAAGRMRMFGPKDAVLARATQQTGESPQPSRATPDAAAAIVSAIETAARSADPAPARAQAGGGSQPMLHAARAMLRQAAEPTPATGRLRQALEALRSTGFDPGRRGTADVIASDRTLRS